MKTLNFIIASVDGGAASGKSSTSTGVSEKLNLLHVDTGSHYRTITHILLNAGLDPSDTDKIKNCLEQTSLTVSINNLKAVISINGKSFTNSDLKSQKVNENVAQFAALPDVRNFLKNYQRSLPDVAKINNFNGIIMEGRDIGSIIFPNADFKFFLEADEISRTNRRVKEGQSDSISNRDKIDSERKTAPLVKPQGAIVIDNSTLTLEEVIHEICGIIENQSNQQES